MLLNWLDLIKFYMNEIENCNSEKKNEEKMKSVRINQGLICFIQPQSWLDENEFNKRAEKSDNHLDILPLH